MSSSSRKKIIIGIALLFLLPMPLIFAEEQTPPPAPPRPAAVTHILGDQGFIINLGAFLPLFFVRTADSVVEGTNLSVGGKLSIEYMNYLSQSFALGLEINFAFAFTPNFNAYFTVPITAKIAYIIPIGACQLFFNLGLGVDFESFIGGSRMDFFGRPQVAFYFPIDPAIDLGLSVGYWFVPQFATAEQEANKVGQSRLGNFLDISVSLIYHF